MMRREVNFLHEVSRDAIDFVEAGGDIRAYPLLRPYYTALVFSMRHPVLQRREVRVAINEAIDRNELVRNAHARARADCRGPVLAVSLGLSAGTFPGRVQPRGREAAARRRRACKVQTGSAQQMPARFAFTCLVLAGDDRFERIAQLVQRQLYAVGIDMQIEPLALKELRPRLCSGDFDAFLLEDGRRTNAELGVPLLALASPWRRRSFPLHRLRRPPTPPSIGCRSRSTDEDVREALSDVMHVLRADPPAAFLVWPREARAADVSLDIPYETDRDVFGTLWQLKRAEPQVTARR